MELGPRYKICKTNLRKVEFKRLLRLFTQVNSLTINSMAKDANM